MITSLMKIVCAVACSLLLLVTSGCSELSATVEGKVYYAKQLIKIDGNQRGKVVFRAVNGGATCMGLIDSTGSYSMSTGTTDALVPGDYLISVSVVEIIPNKDQDFAPKAESIIPKVYNDTLTSGLTLMVKRGKNVHDIRLKAVEAPVMVTDPVKEEAEALSESQSDEQFASTQEESSEESSATEQSDNNQDEEVMNDEPTSTEASEMEPILEGDKAPESSNAEAKP